MRHATAEPWSDGRQDSNRELVEQGRVESSNAGLHAREEGWAPDLVLCSPYVRAEQTASLFCEAAGFSPPTVEQFLTAGMSPASGIDALRDFEKLSQLVVVGHQPDLSLLISALTGTSMADLHVQPASMWGIELDRIDEKAGTLIFSVAPKF